MSNFLAILGAVFVTSCIGGALLAFALDAASRPRPARPLPRKLVCVEVQDPGVGPYWTCAEKRP